MLRFGFPRTAGALFAATTLTLAACDGILPVDDDGAGEGEDEDEVVVSPLRIVLDGVDVSSDGIDFGVVTEAVDLDVVLEAIPPNDDVSVLSDPPVLVGGKDADSFSVTLQPTPTVSIDGAPFRLRYAPAVGGVVDAKLVIAFGVRAAERLVVDVRGESAAAARDPGLRTSIYDGQFDQLPDFDSLVPTSTGVQESIDISARQGTDFYAYRFQGAVDIPADGTWTFSTSSDDGSQLFVDGALVVDNDGLHGVTLENGSVDLSAGLHAFEVTFFEQAGGDSLEVTWQGPGVDTQSIPSSALFTAP